MLSVVLFFALLIVLVCIHEAAHLFAARWFGMRTDCFFVGFGKTLWSRTTKKGLEIGVKAIPAGGFVKIPHMDLRARKTAPEGSYAKAKWWQQVIVALAGVIAQLALTFPILLAATYTLPTGEPVGRIVATSDTRLEVGDRVLSVNGEVYDGEPLPMKADITVERDGDTVVVEDAELGNVVVDHDVEFVTRSFNHRALWSAVATVVLPVRLVDATADAIGKTPEVIAKAWSGGELGDERMRSIIGMADQVKDVSPVGSPFLFIMLLAQINTAIAIFNAIPLYPFDGGHAFNAVMARILRRNEKLCDRFLAGSVLFSLLVFAAFVGLVVFIIASDIVDMTALPGWAGMTAAGAVVAALFAVGWQKRHELVAVAIENTTNPEPPQVRVGTGPLSEAPGTERR